MYEDPAICGFFSFSIAMHEKLCYNSNHQFTGVKEMEEIRICEAEYGTVMRDKIEPFLADIRQEGFFDAKDGLRIHYEMYLHPQSRGAVVIAHGFTESEEKFREMAYRCYAQDYSVFSIDHRGHGRSGRLVMPEFLTHVENFADYLETNQSS